MTGKLGANALARKWRAGFAFGCLGGIILKLVIVLVFGTVVRQQPHRFPAVVQWFCGAGAVVAAADGGPALSLQQIEAIRGVRPTIQVTLTEADINSYLRDHPEAVGLPRGYAAPRVEFRDSLVRFGARTRVLFFAVRFWIMMEPYIEGEDLKLAVRRVEAGNIDLPGELRKIAEDRVADILSEHLGEAGLVPESVEVRDGALTVAARLVPVEEPLSPQPEPEPPTDAPEEVDEAPPDSPATAPERRPWRPAR